MKREPGRRTRIVTVALLLGVSAGCGERAEEHDDARTPQQTSLAAPPNKENVSPPVTLKDLGVQVRVHTTSGGGPGCTSGAFGGFMSDGRELILSFDSNEVWITPTQRRASLQCTARMGIEASAPVSFAVTRLYAQGYTELAPGMNATLRLHYRDPLGAWHGPTQREVDGVGEFHMFRLDQFHRTEELVWSPCATRSEVALQTYFGLTNAVAQAEGTVDMCATDVGGKPDSEAGLTFVWRACTPDPPPAR